MIGIGRPCPHGRAGLPWAGILAIVAVLAACNPVTRRPALTPLPEVDTLAYALPVPAATERLAAQLRQAGFPIARVEARDGYLETPWFDAASGEPTDRRPVGPDVVRLRAWVNPSAPGTSDAAIEAVYHPVADPSLPARLLDRPLPPTHPVAQRLRRLTDSLSGRLAAAQAAREAQAAADSARRARAAADTGAADTAAVDTAAADTAAADTTTSDAARTDTTISDTALADTVRADTTRADTAPAAPAAERFSVQIASTATEAEARRIAERAGSRGFAARVVPVSGRFAVRIGDYATRREAAAALDSVRVRLGGEPFVAGPR